ncbi:MAG: PfkB family carbohydrate kinase [Candidatus Limnocylindrales bacterium]
MPSRYPERGAVDVVHVGNVCRDIDRGDPRGWRLGGGVAYAALTSARLGHRSAAVFGADGIAAGAAEIDLLRSAGVDVHIVPLAQGPIFENVETEHGRVQTCVEPGEPVPVVDLPEGWLAAPAWMVVPVSNETGPEWAGAIPAHARLILGWQGLLRGLVAGGETVRMAPSRGPLVDRANLIGVSRGDLGKETGVAELNRLLRPGTRLVVTEGIHGGVLFEAASGGPANAITYSSIPSQQVDSTGAGDVFLAALVAAWLDRGAPADRPGPTPADLRWAAVAGALVVEAVGLPAVPNRVSVIERLAS